MYPIDATTEHFEAVEILGIPGLFTTQLVNRTTIPQGMYAYDMQTSQEDWSQPCMIGRHIAGEHYGTVLTASPIDLPAAGCRDLNPGDFDQSDGAEHLTVAEFEEKYLSPEPAPPLANRRHKTRAVSAPAR